MTEDDILPDARSQKFFRLSRQLLSPRCQVGVVRLDRSNFHCRRNIEAFLEQLTDTVSEAGPQVRGAT